MKLVTDLFKSDILTSIFLQIFALTTALKKNEIYTPLNLEKSKIQMKYLFLDIHYVIQPGQF